MTERESSFLNYEQFKEEALKQLASSLTPQYFH